MIPDHAMHSGPTTSECCSTYLHLQTFSAMNYTALLPGIIFKLKATKAGTFVCNFPGDRKQWREWENAYRQNQLPKSKFSVLSTSLASLILSVSMDQWVLLLMQGICVNE